ncbi:histidine kinase [Solidesulfovibrio fructosivorans JJ]]|uniref:histidine kinase n=1 Tax=Solidesulfovibrio fructosivorans JJ] TaxID=596151 RepID=E1JZ81_SOLFR|nr:histidine kinase [Solidesulfovibrio fructosivorans JJ]]
MVLTAAAGAKRENMTDHFDFPDIQERLQKLEEAFADHNSYQFRKTVAELRRAIKMRANAEALSRAELLDARKENERNRKQSLDLQTKLKTVVDRFEGSFTAFEKFRKAIRVVELMRGHEDLPAILDRIQDLFGLRTVSLILDAAEFASFDPPGARLADLDAMRKALSELMPGVATPGSFMCPIRDVPDPEFFFGRGFCAERKVLLLGSCFISPLRDKFGPQRLIGILSFFDSNPDRYTREKGSEFASHFADILGYTIVDITDRKKAERLREDVERMTRHDLKSPLTAVLTLPQLLRRDGNLTERQTDMLSLMQHAGYRMLNMINQSLDLYRMERGVYELTPQKVDLLPILDNIAGELHSVIEEHGLTLDILVRGEARAAGDTFVVRGEEMLLYTMLSNLVKNALEASPPGERVTVELAEGKTLAMAIKNAGAVPQQIRATFFEKYATAGKKDGTGLGTYGAKLIAETHGGKIAMHTSEAAGTAVTVFFPKPRAAKAQAAPEPRTAVNAGD